jgi:nitrite reductase/ring-hydroxylating ferredoxin subunit
MKKKDYINISLIILTIHYLFLSCSPSQQERNPYLKDVSFSREINLDLPQYSPLKFANNSIILNDIGIKGVIIFNTGSQFLAWEASDPNHYPSSCSTMEPNQFTCSCPCEENKYSLYDGQLISGEGNYTLKPYHLTVNGNILFVYN